MNNSHLGGLVVLAIAAFIIVMGIKGSQHSLFPGLFGADILTPPDAYANVPQGGTPKSAWPKTMPICPIATDCSCYPRGYYTMQGNNCVKT